ncbi:MAG: eukaryotic-like serine/threonine-protein kinase [Actinomycetota bacterium]|jgi:serine/threonine-protein kinase|nr:eukaryotic-like serine/threonine-protein kinase [Actinomycetota bacterium]
MRSGDRVHDRYVLDARIGSGGMAEVWQARDLRLERDVAIKFLAPQLAQDPEFLVRFFAEAQGVARISHPNVIQVLDFGEFEDRSYLVMELATGGSAKELTGAPVPQDRAAAIVADAAGGAGAAHEHGIIHRDIKPGNILLMEDGVAKLADFGIASIIAGEKLTGTGLAIGSPHYISPEQASGGEATARSDVYSLGVVLFELVTGTRPFDAANVTALAIAHVEQPPPLPREVYPDIGPTLEAIILRCLDKDPQARYPDGAALADALTGSVAGTVVAPVPEAVADETSAFAVTAEPAGLEEAPSRVPLIALAALLVAGIAAAAFWFATNNDTTAKRTPISGVVSSASPKHHKRHKKPSSSVSPTGAVQTSGVVIAPSSPHPTPSPAHTTKAPPPHRTHSPPKPTPTHTSPRPTHTTVPSSSPSP